MVVEARTLKVLSLLVGAGTQAVTKRTAGIVNPIMELKILLIYSPLSPNPFWVVAECI